MEQSLQRLSWARIFCVDAFQLDAKNPVSTGLCSSVAKPSTVRLIKRCNRDYLRSTSVTIWPCPSSFWPSEPYLNSKEVFLVAFEGADVCDLGNAVRARVLKSDGVFKCGLVVSD